MHAARLAAMALAVAVGPAAAADPKDTEVWAPVPRVIDAPASGIPSDAIALFRGGNLDQWESVNGGPAIWSVGTMAVVVRPGAGDIRTKASFCDIQLHLEWMTPTDIFGDDGKKLQGQNRNNSGVFLQERYEIQILDSHGDARTYANGQAASIYKQAIPLVNASRPPGVWQNYDVFYRAPKFNAAGAVTQKARVTLLHNGVLVQDNFEIRGPTAFVGTPPYQAHGCEPLSLQDHGDKISFRNIWVRPL